MGLAIVEVNIAGIAAADTVGAVAADTAAVAAVDTAAVAAGIMNLHRQPPGWLD